MSKLMRDTGDAMRPRKIIVLLFLVLIGAGCTLKLDSVNLPVRRITLPVQYAMFTRFSHGGKRIAYELYCSDQVGIWIADRDGRHARQVQPEQFPDAPPPCSTPAPPKPGELVKPLPFDMASYRPRESYGSPHWSPDDSKLAYFRGVTLIALSGMEKLINCKSSGPERLCPGTVIYDLNTGEHLSLDMMRGASFSPDGQKAAVFRECTWERGSDKCVEISPESAQIIGDNFGLQVIDLSARRVVYTDTAALLDVMRESVGESFPWSPDGQSLCYPVWAGGAGSNSPYPGELRIARVDAPGSQVDLTGRMCAWAPDSRRISYVIYPSSRYYTSTRTGLMSSIIQAELHVYDLLTNQDRLLFAGETFQRQFNQVGWSPDGKYIAFPFDFIDEKRIESTKGYESPRPQPRLIVVEVATGKYWQSESIVDVGSVNWMEWGSDSTKVFVLAPRVNIGPESYYLEIAVP
jgi:hypothetical protein